MLRRTCAFATIASALFMLAATDAAVALPQRTFVASTGNDSNPCTIALPCRGFATAVGQTISGGEVIVLDSAGYGPVVISQSVSIIAPAGVYAGITVSSGAGVHVNTAGVNVVLRGLSINSTGGSYGIRMTDGDELLIENCAISNFVVGYGVSIETSAHVKIHGTLIRDNTSGISVSLGATANITNSQVIESVSTGIVLGNTSSATNVYIADTLVTGTGKAGFTICIYNFANGAVGHISVTRVTVTGCATAILNAPPTSGVTTVSNSLVTGNVDGLSRSAGTFNSLGNNDVHGNTNDTVGAITNILPI